MNITFDNIRQHVTPMSDFRLQWRFTEEQYDKLPNHHLDQLQPLDNEASNFLWDYVTNIHLYHNAPFNKDLFRIIDKVKVVGNNKKEIKKWLYHRGLPFDKQVFLSWQPTDAMIVPWKLLIKYFDSFYYPSDDLTVIDPSLTWALLFHHKDEIYFGTNKDFKPSTAFANTDFIW